MKNYQIQTGEEPRLRIELWARLCGNDLQVTICGGTGYHIGASALASPVSEYHGRPAKSATVSSICLPGHKDDEIARSAAKYLSAMLERTVQVTAGIHIDQPLPAELHQLVQNSELAYKKLAIAIQKGENHDEKSI